MKHLLPTLACMVLLVGACKKEDAPSQTPEPVYSAPYKHVAPACLITHDSSYYGEAVYTYDNQKRLIKRSRNHDTIATTYRYIGNAIIETASILYNDTLTYNYSRTHYLNTNGLIDSTIDQWGAPIRYIYNSMGYLMLKYVGYTNPISYEYRYQSRYSYQYSNGNMITEYRANQCWKPGTYQDSTLEATYTYYLDRPSKMGHFNAWVEPAGRSSTNELKSKQSKTKTETYTYTWGTNGLPNHMNYHGTNAADKSVTYAWKCN